MGAARSYPPSAFGETRPRPKHLGPGTEPAHPLECERVKAGDRAAVAALNRVLMKRGTSNVELAEVVECPETTIRAIRSGERRKPFKVGLLYAIDRRTALAVLDEIRTELLLSLCPHKD